MEIYNGEYTVYCHKNKSNGKNYIGITKMWPPTLRWHCGGGYASQPKFYNAIKKYGWDGFEHIVIASKLTESEAKNFEILLIEKLDCINNGYNVSRGGDSGNCIEYTPEIRAAISARTKGENNPRYGVKLTQETKDKISQSLMGRKIPEQTRGGNPMARKIYYNGMIFGCIKDVADYLGYNKDTVQGWLSKPGYKPPQYIVDNGFGYYGEELIKEGYQRKVRHYKTVCEGKEFHTPSECANFYGIKPSTMVKWLNGINPMPKEWQDKGLQYV